MKALAAIFMSMMLGGCASTWVHIDESGGKSGCQPVVSVHSFGSNVVVTDGSECKAKK